MKTERELFEEWWAGHNSLFSGTKQQARFVWFSAIDAVAEEREIEQMLNPKQPKRKP